MKNILLFVLLLATGVATAQEARQMVLEGYVFTEDSLPAENAHLINYRTSRIVTTNGKGFFRTNIRKGDSLMINHLSLSPKVLHTGELFPGQAVIIYVPYRTYILKAISSGNYEKEQKNVQESMKQVKKDIEKQIIVKPYQQTLENPYDNDKENPGITIPIIQLGPSEKKRIGIDE
ncbi:MAG: hypothetical protein AB7D05_06160 [Mangrovibacterium sp.]